MFDVKVTVSPLETFVPPVEAVNQPLKFQPVLVTVGRSPNVVLNVTPRVAEPTRVALSSVLTLNVTVEVTALKLATNVLLEPTSVNV